MFWSLFSISVLNWFIIVLFRDNVASTSSFARASLCCRISSIWFTRVLSNCICWARSKCCILASSRARILLLCPLVKSFSSSSICLLELTKPSSFIWVLSFELLHSSNIMLKFWLILLRLKFIDFSLSSTFCNDFLIWSISVSKFDSFEFTKVVFCPICFSNFCSWDLTWTSILVARTVASWIFSTVSTCFVLRLCKSVWSFEIRSVKILKLSVLPDTSFSISSILDSCSVIFLKYSWMSSCLLSCWCFNRDNCVSMPLKICSWSSIFSLNSLTINPLFTKDCSSCIILFCSVLKAWVVCWIAVMWVLRDSSIFLKFALLTFWASTWSVFICSKEFRMVVKLFCSWLELCCMVFMFSLFTVIELFMLVIDSWMFFCSISSCLRPSLCWSIRSWIPSNRPSNFCSNPSVCSLRSFVISIWMFLDCCSTSVVRRASWRFASWRKTSADSSSESVVVRVVLPFSRSVIRVSCLLSRVSVEFCICSKRCKRNVCEEFQFVSDLSTSSSMWWSFSWSSFNCSESWSDRPVFRSKSRLSAASSCSESRFVTVSRLWHFSLSSWLLELMFSHFCSRMETRWISPLFCSSRLVLRASIWVTFVCRQVLLASTWLTCAASWVRLCWTVSNCWEILIWLYSICCSPSLSMSSMNRWFK